MKKKNVRNKDSGNKAYVLSTAIMSSRHLYNRPLWRSIYCTMGSLRYQTYGIVVSKLINEQFCFKDSWWSSIVFLYLWRDYAPSHEKRPKYAAEKNLHVRSTLKQWLHCRLPPLFPPPSIVQIRRCHLLNTIRSW